LVRLGFSQSLLVVKSMFIMLLLNRRLKFYVESFLRVLKRFLNYHFLEI